jgi:antitoxin component of MazEF toxin-antitoxin module
VVCSARATESRGNYWSLEHKLVAKNCAVCGPNNMRIRNREVYTTRYFRNGNSNVITIPPDIGGIMKLVPGDNLAMNFQHGVLWMVKIVPGMIASRETVSKIFDEIFKDKEKANAG